MLLPLQFFWVFEGKGEKISVFGVVFALTSCLKKQSILENIQVNTVIIDYLLIFNVQANVHFSH